MTTKQPPVTWTGDVRACDICHSALYDKEFFIDGKTRQGPWALMCLSCWERRGVSLGMGYGQQYKRTGKDWIKVAG